MGKTYRALRYSENMWEDCKNGVWTLECNSWKEFEDIIEEFKKAKYKYMWRGQSCEKSLLPTIYRYSKPNKDNIEQHLNQFKQDMPGANALKDFLDQARNNNIPEFKKALCEYCTMTISNADANHTIENFINDIYWAIGQHHGLKTPLLDWTMDPYKALFFAFCGRKAKDGKRIVFGFAEKTRLLMRNKQPKKRYIEFLNNLNFVQKILGSYDSQSYLKQRISLMFGRINAQEGIFTRSLHTEDVEKHAKRCYDYYKNHKKKEIVFLIRILIPHGVRKDFLEKLEGKKITYKTIFPDLQGAALQCNLKLELSQ